MVIIWINLSILHYMKKKKVKYKLIKETVDGN